MSTAEQAAWRVSTNACFDGIGTEYTVGTKTQLLGPNTPFSTGPTSWDLSGVPVAGGYHVCAKIDANDSITETSEVDNQLWSDGTITVQN
jgi:hypothetical protein